MSKFWLVIGMAAIAAGLLLIAYAHSVDTTPLLSTPDWEITVSQPIPASPAGPVIPVSVFFLIIGFVLCILNYPWPEDDHKEKK